MTNSEQTSPRIIRKKEVIQLTGLSQASIYRLMASNDFPKQIQITCKAVGWIESEVIAWIESTIQKARN
jgi:prophage regulatory protein